MSAFRPEAAEYRGGAKWPLWWHTRRFAAAEAPAALRRKPSLPRRILQPRAVASLDKVQLASTGSSDRNRRLKSFTALFVAHGVVPSVSRSHTAIGWDSWSTWLICRDCAATKLARCRRRAS